MAKLMKKRKKWIHIGFTCCNSSVAQGRKTAMRPVGLSDTFLLHLQVVCILNCIWLLKCLSVQLSNTKALKMNGSFAFLNVEKITWLLLYSSFASHINDIFHDPSSLPLTAK